MKAYWGVEVQLHTFFISALDGGEWSASCPSHFNVPLDTLLNGYLKRLHSSLVTAFSILKGIKMPNE
jgi:hypothetical protein